MDTFFQRYEECCNALSYHLKEQGIEKDPGSWPRDHWYHKVDQDMKQVAAIIRAEDSFILVDENHWLTGDKVLGRKRIVFPEKDGNYWGPPEDDKTAINELENDRNKGASFIVFTWPAFWWLDYYKGFNEHLQSNYNCVLKNERLIIFNLNDQ